MICKRCGANITDGSKFCLKCGCKVSGVEKERQVEINKEKHSYISSKKIIIIIVIVFLLGGIYYFRKLNNKSFKEVSNVDMKDMQKDNNIVKPKNEEASKKNTHVNENENKKVNIKLEAIKFSSADVSSYLSEEGIGEIHDGYKAIDDDIKSAWIYSKGENGEWIKLNLPKETQICKLYIFNGFGKSEQLYYENNRIKKIRMEFSDGTSQEKELEDGILDKQEIEVSDVGIKTSYVKITILDVYKGSKYSDTCVSEINALGIKDYESKDYQFKPIDDQINGGISSKEALEIIRTAYSQEYNHTPTEKGGNGEIMNDVYNPQKQISEQAYFFRLQKKIDNSLYNAWVFGDGTYIVRAIN